MKYGWWRSGDYNTICDVCGFKYKASELQQRWDGLMVCAPDWEMRHPQEMIRPIPDQNKLPWTRPDPTDIFVSGATANYCTPLTTCIANVAIADLAIANCVINAS